MRSFGFLSFGHYAIGNQQGPSAREALTQAVDIAVAADELGINNASFRVHHFAPQGAAPISLLSTIAARTSHIEVGTGVIDMRYENPLHLAEELGALDLLAGARLAIGVSRGSPEPTVRGWEAFGYTAKAPNGADMAREKFLRLLDAVSGYGVTTAAPAEEQYPFLYQPGSPLPVFPYSEGLRQRIWWGSGTNKSAIQAAKDGVNLMSSTLVSEADGRSLGELQSEQIAAFRDAWAEAGHDWQPRVSVSRSVFPIIDDETHALFGDQATGRDQVGSLGEDGPATFGRT